MTSQDHHAMLEQHNDAERERQEREIDMALRAVCKPWECHTGNPPADDSPLAAVFGAGMGYTERLLARLLDVERYEGGDGSEDFDQDATKALENILTAAKLYDPEDGVWAKLETADAGGQATPHSDVAQAVAAKRCADPIGCTAPCHDDDGVRYCDVCGRWEGCRVAGKTPSMLAARAPHPPTPRPGASVEGLRALSAKATAGTWEADTFETEGDQGHYMSNSLVNDSGHVIADTCNGGLQCIAEEHSEDDYYRWDEQGKADMAFAAAAVNHVRAALAQSNPARTPEGAPPRDGGPSR